MYSDGQIKEVPAYLAVSQWSISCVCDTSEVRSFRNANFHGKTGFGSLTETPCIISSVPETTQGYERVMVSFIDSSHERMTQINYT